MSRISRRFAARLAAVLCFALALPFAGCEIVEEGNTIVEPEPTPPPVPVTVTAAGACEVNMSSINCIDSSTSNPAGELHQVVWTLRRGNATEVASKSAQPGDSISFGPGLPLATYTVEQTVQATDGSVSKRTYPDLTVFTSALSSLSGSALSLPRFASWSENSFDPAPVARSGVTLADVEAALESEVWRAVSCPACVG